MPLRSGNSETGVAEQRVAAEALRFARLARSLAFWHQNRSIDGFPAPRPAER